MAEIPMMYTLNSLPGIQRDGTPFDSKSFVDGQWVRFMRGRPKKMGGIRQISDKINGPVRGAMLWSRQELQQVSLFSAFGIEALQIDRNGTGAGLYDRTPSAFAVDVNVVWQYDTMYDAAAGSTKTLLFAHPGSNLVNIDDGTERDVYYGDAADTNALVPIGGTALVSGGILAMPPYLTLYGSDGRVSWSNQNEPRNFTSGDAGTARITGSKIVKGLPIRGQGTSPSALLWALEGLHKMSYIGGQAIFRFDPLSNASTILSSSSVIEYDGSYFWVGLDRFMMFNGKVQELPNDQNLNWFFDNLNYTHRQKVHVAKNTRYGEIWWFFPKGDATECTHAVIYNVRQNFWYDVECPRSASTNSQVFRYPILADSTTERTTLRVRVANASAFVVGDVATGATSGGAGKITKILGNNIYLLLHTFVVPTNGETLNGQTAGSSVIQEAPYDVTHHSLWIHEFGKNIVKGDHELAIPSYFESANFGFPIGGAASPHAPLGPDRWTRLTRVEPDFVLSGKMTMQVNGGETAGGNEVLSKPYELTASTERIDLREQRREVRLRFTSNEVNGDYEMGKVLMHIEEGDVRS